MADSTQFNTLNQILGFDPAALPYVDTLDSLISLEKLQEQATVDLLDKLVKATIYFENASDANELISRLKNIDNLKTVSPALFKRYDGLRTKLYFTAFEGRSLRQLQEMFSKNMLVALKDGIEIKAKLELLFWGVGLDYYPKIKEALEGNQETLGNKNITLKAGANTLPTIANWIKNYTSSLPIGGRPGAYDLVNYSNTSSNTRLLSAEEKIILREVLSIYDWLRHPIIDFRFLYKPTEGSTTLTGIPITSVPDLERDQDALDSEPNRGAQRSKSPQTVSRTLEIPPPEAIVPISQVQQFLRVQPVKAPPIPAVRPRDGGPKVPSAVEGLKKPVASPWDLSRVISSEHRLEDLLERVRLRVEAGLDLSEEDIDLIIELMKEKRNQ